MTPQELKASILQLAIQGKLVEQRAEEGTAEQMFTHRQYRRVVDHDDLMDLPDTWDWVYLPDIADILYGYPFNSELFNETQTGVPLIRIRDVNTGSSNTYTTEECDSRYLIQHGDMLVGMDGNFQVAFWKSCPAWLNQRVCKITADSSVLDQKYLYFYLPIVLKEINKTVSYSTVKHLSAKLLNQMIIPLPPLAEQKRIVAKIEELLPYIDRYEQAWSRLEDFNRRFPVDMQKSILQMAIQGKLVEQRPEEGTGEELYQQIQQEKQRLIKAGTIKKEKPLPEITEDEIPFDIPEGWMWVRLGILTAMITSGSRDWAQYYSDTGDIFLRMGNLSRNSFNLRLDKIQRVKLPQNAEGKRTSLQAGDLLFSITGEVGTLGLIPDGFGTAYINQHTAMIRFLTCERNRYIPYLLLTDYAQKFYNGNQHGIKNSFRLDTIAMLPIPLPPLAEQKRIVAKLEEILPLCDRLK